MVDVISKGLNVHQIEKTIRPAITTIAAIIINVKFISLFFIREYCI